MNVYFNVSLNLRKITNMFVFEFFISRLHNGLHFFMHHFVLTIQGDVYNTSEKPFD